MTHRDQDTRNCGYRRGQAPTIPLCANARCRRQVPKLTSESWVPKRRGPTEPWARELHAELGRPAAVSPRMRGDPLLLPCRSVTRSE